MYVRITTTYKPLILPQLYDLYVISWNSGIIIFLFTYLLKQKESHNLYTTFLIHMHTLALIFAEFNLPITFKVILLLSITGGVVLFAIHWITLP